MLFEKFLLNLLVNNCAAVSFLVNFIRNRLCQSRFPENVAECFRDSFFNRTPVNGWFWIRTGPSKKHFLANNCLLRDCLLTLLFAKFFTCKYVVLTNYKWDKIFTNGRSKTCGRQPLNNLKWYGLLKLSH